MAENEEILIKRCIQWDRDAQNRLYKLFAPKMFGVCLRYSKNKEEAEDTLQEGFMKVFENIGKFRSEGSLEGWVRRIMVNVAIQKFRRDKSSSPTIISIDNPDRIGMNMNHHSADDITGQMEAKELMGMIQQLPPRYQMVFNLYVFEGLKHREIAEQLGITEGTSKSNLSDARAILQRAVNNSMKTANVAR